MFDIIKNFQQKDIFMVLSVFISDILFLVFLFVCANYLESVRNAFEHKTAYSFLKIICFLAVLFVVVINAKLFINV